MTVTAFCNWRQLAFFRGRDAGDWLLSFLELVWGGGRGDWPQSLLELVWGGGRGDWPLSLLELVWGGGQEVSLGLLPDTNARRGEVGLCVSSPQAELLSLILRVV